MKKNAMPRHNGGFTIVELLVSIGILTILFALTTINLIRLPSSTSQSSSYDRLVSDLRGQQTKAMVGYNSAAYGVHFETAGYTIFNGSNYSPGDPSNFTVEPDPNLTFTDIKFPNNQVVFAAGSGDAVGYMEGEDSVSITNALTGDFKTLKLNKYGATY